MEAKCTDRNRGLQPPDWLAVRIRRRIGSPAAKCPLWSQTVWREPPSPSHRDLDISAEVFVSG
eukprot:scaffold692_cov203-Alexandrium_tamarense.AAC.11